MKKRITRFTFTLSNSIILVDDKVKERLKRGFEIFLIDHYTGDNENKNIAGLNNSCISVNYPIPGRSAHVGCYIYNSLVHIICTIYLHVAEAYLRATIVMFYFCHLKNPSNIMKNIFNFISIYY